MKLKKQLASLAVMGMMSLVAASSAFASGVGYVNFDTLVQSHKDFPKVSAQMQAAVKDANEQFAKKAPKMKTDQERQNLGRELAQNLSKLENKLIVPIEKRRRFQSRPGPQGQRPRLHRSPGCHHLW